MLASCGDVEAGFTNATAAHIVQECHHAGWAGAVAPVTSPPGPAIFRRVCGLVRLRGGCRVRDRTVTGGNNVRAEDSNPIQLPGKGIKTASSWRKTPQYFTRVNCYCGQFVAKLWPGGWSPVMGRFVALEVGAPVVVE